QSYTLVAADVGHEIKCRVTATNAGGSDSATSAGGTPAPKPLDAPAATTAPSVPAAGRTGDTLTCNPGTWSGSPTFAFQWLRDGAPIAGATSPTYKLTDADVGHNISCRVTATNAGGSTTRASNALLVAG